MIIGIDGSTYKYHPFFNFWVCEKLKDLVDHGLEVVYIDSIHYVIFVIIMLQYQVLQTGDGSGRGAALVAAIASRLSTNNRSTAIINGSSTTGDHNVYRFKPRNRLVSQDSTDH